MDLPAGSIRGLALFVGIGGLELGLHAALGPAYRCVAVVEREAYCIETLARRMREGQLDDCPVWSDVCTFDGRAWRGRVDLVSAGFPCQPASVAGKRRGQEDERWLWPHVARIVREVEPRWVFLENVRGLLSAGDGAAFGEVLGDLAGLGFAAEWDVFRASDVGAPHRRERVFVLAHRNLDGLESLGRGRLLDPERSALGDDADGCGGEAVADADGFDGDPERHGPSDVRRKRASAPEVPRRMANPVSRELRNEPGRWGGSDGSGAAGARDAVEDVGDAPKFGWREGWPQHELRSGRHAAADDGRFLWPPCPADRAGWADYIRAGGPVPALRRGSDGLSSRLDRLRALGNGVVPAQAALAFRILAARLGA